MMTSKVPDALEALADMVRAIPQDPTVSHPLTQERFWIIWKTLHRSDKAELAALLRSAAVVARNVKTPFPGRLRKEAA